ncbi:MAG: hypothetical protein V1874_08810 [Spirochaetota bacterium]
MKLSVIKNFTIVKHFIPTFFISVCILLSLNIISCSGGDANNNSAGTETMGKIDLNIYLNFNSITEIANQYNYLTSSTTNFYSVSSCINFNVEATLTGTETYHNYSNTGAWCSLGEYLDNKNSSVLLYNDYFKLRDFKPGIYSLKLEQKEDYAIEFWRQDVYLNTYDMNAVDTLYFDFVQSPTSITFEIKAGETTTVNINIDKVELENMVTINGKSWLKETVDPNRTVGEYSSIALDSNDNPHISYYYHNNNYSNGNLKYARWTGSTWSISTIDTGVNLGLYTSIAIDNNNRPHISYLDASSNRDLKYARWTGSSWSIATVDSAYIGYDTSLVIDSSGNPHISYCDLELGILMYAKWTETSWTFDSIDAPYVGLDNSITLDSNNNPHISYYDTNNDYLKYARWTGSNWSIATVDSNDNVGCYSLLAIDSNDNPHISYYDATNTNLKYASWNGSNWSIVIVDSNGDVGKYSSLALDSNDYPHITYYDETNGNLKYARWTGNNWLIIPVDRNGTVGKYSSIALDINDNPHISYHDGTNGSLKYAKFDY